MSSPLVSVIILHHENKAQPYLDRCLNSLENIVKYALLNKFTVEVLVIASSIEPPQVPEWVRLFRIEHTISGPIAANFGASQAHPDSQYFLHCNDDVIFSFSSIFYMVKHAKDRRVILNPLSNCDNGWLYEADITIGDGFNKGYLQQKRFYRLEEVNGFENYIMDYESLSKILIPAAQLCMFATLFPRTIWEELGGYDVSYVCGFADTDLSLRATRKGIKLLVDLGAFIFHYGGVTTDGTLTNEVRLQDQNTFIAKWGMEIFKRIAG